MYACAVNVRVPAHALTRFLFPFSRACERRYRLSEALSRERLGTFLPKLTVPPLTHLTLDPLLLLRIKSTFPYYYYCLYL